MKSKVAQLGAVLCCLSISSTGQAADNSAGERIGPSCISAFMPSHPGPLLNHAAVRSQLLDMYMDAWLAREAGNEGSIFTILPFDEVFEAAKNAGVDLRGFRDEALRRIEEYERAKLALQKRDEEQLVRIQKTRESELEILRSSGWKHHLTIFETTPHYQTQITREGAVIASEKEIYAASTFASLKKLETPIHDVSRIVSNREGSVLGLLKPNKLEVIHLTLSRHTGYATSASVSGKFLDAALTHSGASILARSRSTATLFDSISLKVKMRFLHPMEVITSMALSPDGSFVATTTDASKLRVWNAKQRWPMWKFGQTVLNETIADAQVRVSNFSSDGQRLVVYWNGNARLYDTRDWSIVELKGHDRDITAVSFSNDSSRLVSVDEGGFIRIWDARTGTPLKVLNGEAPLVDAAFSPDGTMIITAQKRSAALLWDVQTGRLITTLTGRDDLITKAMFSPDGNRAIVEYEPKYLMIWNKP